VGATPMSLPSRRIAGILLLTLVTVEFGGYFMTRISRGQEELTEFQTSFARAGHGHAGVLIVLALVCLVLADAIKLGGAVGYVARLAIPAAAVLMSAGFFLSSMGVGVTEPNGWIAVLWLGAACLAVGVVTLGVALLRRPRTPSAGTGARSSHDQKG
jgi:hypothetical protein